MVEGWIADRKNDQSLAQLTGDNHRLIIVQGKILDIFQAHAARRQQLGQLLANNGQLFRFEHAGKVALQQPVRGTEQTGPHNPGYGL